MVYELDIRVRYSETDQMGVVYHANYLPWFEEARTAFLEAVGLPYAALEEQGLLIPVLECACRYRSPARYGQTVRVQAWISEIKGVRFRVQYRVLGPDGCLLADGSTAHVFVDRDFRPIPMARRRPDVWDALVRNAGGPEE